MLLKTSEEFNHRSYHTDTGEAVCWQQRTVFNFESWSSGFNFQFQTKQQVCTERQGDDSWAKRGNGNAFLANFTDCVTMEHLFVQAKAQNQRSLCWF